MKRSLLALMIGTALSITDAQAETDNLLWTSASVSARVSPILKAKTQMQVRYDNNGSELERIAHGGELSLQLFPFLMEVTGGVRAISERSKSGDREPTNRWYLQLEDEVEVGRVEIAYRLGFQHEQELDEDEPSKRIRNRLCLTMDTDTRFKPLVSAELFTNPEPEPIEHKKVRLATGSTIKLTKQHRLKLRLQLQKSLDGDDETERIMSVDYGFRFPKK